MVKKVKRFVVFILFSFFYSLLAGKTAGAAGRVCLVPKSATGDLRYNGKDVVGTAASSIGDSSDFCY